MRIVLWAMIAAMALVVVVQRCNGQVIKFTPQPRPQKYVRVYDALVCAPPDAAAPLIANLAMVSRYAPPELPILNVYARGYEQGRAPRTVLARIGDTLAGLSDGFVTGVATGAIEYDGRLTIAAAVYSGAWKIAGRVFRETQNLALTAQPYWDERPVQVSPGTCQQAAVAALRSEYKSERRAIESRSIEVRIPVNPPLSRLSHPARFDAIDWNQQAAVALGGRLAPAACVVRPSSVESEDGCGESWYG